MPKGATTTGLGENLIACVMLLEGADHQIDLVPLLFLHGHQQQHEVGADGEMLRVVADDERLEIAPRRRPRRSALA